MNTGTNETQLSTAIVLAVKIHEQQTDKQGEPYYLHPLTVMWNVNVDGLDARERMLVRSVAVLHDTLEDYEDTDSLRQFKDQLYNLLGPDGYSALEALTRYPDEGYVAYIGRVCQSWIARRVKIADLQHNLDPERPIPESLAERYRLAVARLVEVEGSVPC